jgi:hypothetical protein
VDFTYIIYLMNTLIEIANLLLSKADMLAQVSKN